MKAVSEQQASYRTALIRRNLKDAKTASSLRTPGLKDLDVSEAAKSDDTDRWYLDARNTRRIVNLALMLALPEPATSAECGEQIDSLKNGGGLSYGETHPGWDREVRDRLGAAWGTVRDQLPKVVTVASLRAIATGVTNG